MVHSSNERFNPQHKASIDAIVIVSQKCDSSRTWSVRYKPVCGSSAIMQMPGCALALQLRRRYAGVDQETDMQLRIASNASRFKTRNLFVLKGTCFNVPLDGADFFAQQDHMRVFKFVLDCLDFLNL